MSAYISVILQDAGYLFTDGASYDRDGVVAAFTNKTRVAPTAPIAFTSRGNAMIGDRLITFLSNQAEKTGVDALISNMPVILDELKSMEISEFAGPNATEVAFVAWSETKGPVHRYFATDDHPYDDGTIKNHAFQVYEPKALYVSGSTVSEGDMAAMPQRSALDPDEGFVGRVGLHIMECMRQHPVEMKGQNGSATHHIIGGHVDMTTVTSAGVRTERIHVWPDRVGQYIVPHAPGNVVAITRQQRRAIEREARKRTA